MSYQQLLPAADAELRRRAEEVGESLQRAVETLVNELGGLGIRDQRAIQAAFDLSQAATSKLLSSIRRADPLATLNMIPGPEALGQMAAGAARAGVSPTALLAAEDAIARLRSFVDGEIGGRATLDAMLSDWVQESRASFELRHKSAAFKAMSAVRGVQADLVFNAGIVYPAAQGERLDCIGLDALLGCRRVRPTGSLRLSGAHMPPPGASFELTSLAGAPVASMHELLLPEYSTLQAERFETARHGQRLEATVHDLPLSQRNARGQDIVNAQVFRGLHRRHRGEGGPTAGFAGQAEPPAEVCVVDALVHDEVWPDVQPQLSLFDTVVRGIAHPDDPWRQADRLDMLESVQSLGRGPDAFRLPEFPRYTELVRDVCGRLGWDASRLRGWRVRVRYPIYGAQIGLSFRLPD